MRPCNLYCAGVLTEPSPGVLQFPDSLRRCPGHLGLGLSGERASPSPWSAQFGHRQRSETLLLGYP